MNRPYKEISRFFAVVPIIFLLFSCGTSMKNLVLEGAATVDTSSSRDVHFSHVKVYESDAGLLISGELHKNTHGRGPIRGHIHIEVITPDGSNLATTSIEYLSSRSQTSRFSIEMPIEVPMNITVKIVHH